MIVTGGARGMGAAYVASDAASDSTGSEFVVDGGWTAGRPIG